MRTGWAPGHFQFRPTSRAKSRSDPGLFVAGRTESKPEVMPAKGTEVHFGLLWERPTTGRAILEPDLVLNLLRRWGPFGKRTTDPDAGVEEVT